VSRPLYSFIVAFLCLVSVPAAAQELRSDNLQPCTGPSGTIQGNQFVVGDDPGGCARTYRRSMQSLAHRGVTPVLTGQANSAATLWTNVRGACATETASLTFHGLEARYGWTSQDREEFISWHPAALQGWIRATGVLNGSEHQTATLRPPELWNYVLPCQVTQMAYLSARVAKRKAGKRR